MVEWKDFPRSLEADKPLASLEKLTDSMGDLSIVGLLADLQKQ